MSHNKRSSALRGPEPNDELEKLENMLRPQSVPSWLVGSGENPRVPQLPPRTNYQTTDQESFLSLERTGKSRPRAPILKPSTESSSTVKPRTRRNRNTSIKRTNRIEQSLDESLESIEFFEKNNRGRQLSCRDDVSVQELQENHGGSIHFVNIEETLELDQAQQEGFSDVKMYREPVETLSGGITSMPSTKFRIPELPRGTRLVINILSTWGDPFYVGLMGLEVFDHTGHLVSVTDVEKQLSADPPDLNVNSPGKQDPRTIDKILDGHNHTCDQLHSWLAPFQRGENHYIVLDFDSATAISMIRIWNLNTTRIHSFRGARYVEISLDDQFIFKGEIRRALGAIVEVELCSECILFTSNETVLHLIEKYDTHYQKASDANDEVIHRPSSQGWTAESNRPKTGDRRIEKLDSLLQEGTGMMKPGNIAASNDRSTKGMLSPPASTASVSSNFNSPVPAFRPRTAPLSRGTGSGKPEMGQILQVYILCNWGDPFTVGLSGIHILDTNFEPLRFPPAAVTLGPRIKSCHKLFEEPVVTTDAKSMWQIPLEHCGVSEPIFSIDFGIPITIAAFKFWNYNASLEDTYCGAKRIIVVLDGRVISPPQGFLIRKGPGNATFDFGQFVQPCSPVVESTPSSLNERAPPATADARPKHDALSLTFSDPLQATSNAKRLSIPPKIEEEMVLQQYHTPLFPCGCIIKFVLLSTWGDQFYIGLNGIELYDAQNVRIEIPEDGIEAVPRDINVLRDSNDLDVRTLDKVIDGINNTYDDHHMWLAPYTPGQSQPNQIFVFFDEPVAISKIMCWNYSKTPLRGVREFEVHMDDVLIYHGIMKKAPEMATTQVGGSRNINRRRAKGKMDRSAPDMGQTILFTNDLDIVEDERQRIYLPDEEEEDSVMFIDNEQVLSNGSNMSNVRPMTSSGRDNPNLQTQHSR